ncbi:MAG: flagellar hook-basal body complex protein FliE [Armatimonadetes bacterium]|nr:flagellar hook-basal body complex protein FliE [Armatimonadota bacterium]
MRIDAIGRLQQGQAPTAGKSPVGGDDFGRMLTDALKEVNDAQMAARDVQNDLMAGRKVEYHDLVFAMERASVALQLTMQVRNKLLEAYQEIQRMQV